MANYDKYYEYTTIHGDTWDSIALDFYNDEYQAKTLLEANPEYSAVLIFEAGVVLKVPIIDDQAAESLPPWRKS